MMITDEQFNMDSSKISGKKMKGREKDKKKGIDFFMKTTPPSTKALIQWHNLNHYIYWIEWALDT